MDANLTDQHATPEEWLEIPPEHLPTRNDQPTKHDIPRPTAPTLEENNWRHAMWGERRAKVATALRAAGASELTMERFHCCGGGCTVEWSRELMRPRLRASYCKNRHCEPCMHAKANTIASNVRREIHARPSATFRFITLTLKHNADPLADQVKRLLASFKKLRDLREWKDSQVGGLYTLEVKFNPAGSIAKETHRQRQTHEWHPHLHVISEGNFIDWKQLRACWMQITKDSTQVDIRSIPDAKCCVHYVTKYIAKGTSPQVWEDGQIASEWICSIRGVRMTGTYGSWRGVKLTRSTREKNDWRPLCTLTQLLEACRRDELWAKNIFNQLRPEKGPGRTRSPPEQTAD